MCEAVAGKPDSEASCMMLDAAREAVEHGLALARLALAGPDPEMAALYLSDALAAAAEAVHPSP